MRRAVVHLFALALVASALTCPPAGADLVRRTSDDGPVAYVHPVDAPVRDPFRPPTSPYGPGNRGLEYDTPAGAEVRAAGPGRVTFAGEVAGARHVTVRHPDGRLTSYSFLASIEVRAGAVVERGQVIGRTAGPVHVSVREDGRYVDPALVFGVEVVSVRLVPENPPGSPLWQEAAREVIELGLLTRLEAGGGFSVGDVIGAVGDVGGAALGAAGDIGGAALGLAGDVGEAALDAADAALPLLVEVALAVGPLALAAVTTPVVSAVVFSIVVPVLMGEEPPLLHVLRESSPFAIVQRVVRRTAEWWHQRGDCTPSDVEPPAPAERRIAVLVAGLDSTSEGASVGDLPVDALGYAPGDVLAFSYRGGRTPDALGAGSGPVSADLARIPVAAYDDVDSTTDLVARGALLADLLTDVARSSPGTTVDLLAHSQGGVVVRLALAELADRPGGEAVLASLGLVATMGTPHQGADLATVALLVAETGEGGIALAVADRLLDQPLDPRHATNLVDLAVSSPLLDDVAAAGLPPGPDYLTLAARGDPLVPVERTRLDGARQVVLGVDGLSAHGALPGHPATARELALGLAGLPPTCVGLLEHVVDTAVAETVHVATTYASETVAELTMRSVVPELVAERTSELLGG